MSLLKKTAHLFSVIFANDTKEREFWPRNFSSPQAGIGPLASEASALTTELPC